MVLFGVAVQIFNEILMRLAVHLGTTVSQRTFCFVFFRDAFAYARSCTSGRLVVSKKKLGHRILNNLFLLEQQIGQLQQKFVCALTSVLCVKNNDAFPHQTWRQNFLKCGTRRHSWTNVISRADQCNSTGTCIQATQRSKSREKLRHSWDPRKPLGFRGPNHIHVNVQRH